MTDVDVLLRVLPVAVCNALDTNEKENLVEVVLDLERPIELRFNDNSFIELSDQICSAEDIQTIEQGIGKFGTDNRAGITKTLHRISRILNRYGDTVGLTCRVGKAVRNCISLLQDIIDEGQSVLVIGKPGVGKTTKLRDIARHLSDDLYRRVVIVDTSNEIGGDGDLPHVAVGRSRRLSVPFGKEQYAVMREAVENHMPQAIVIDEISDTRETDSARSIAQRGVQIIATAHGSKLEDILQNPPLCGLVGGVKSVQIGDDLMRSRGLTSKTVQERQFPPIFDVVVELVAFDEIRIHKNVAQAVDAILVGGTVEPEIRRFVDGRVVTISEGSVKLPVSDRLAHELKPSKTTSFDEDFVEYTPSRPHYSRKRRDTKSHGRRKNY